MIHGALSKDLRPDRQTVGEPHEGSYPRKILTAERLLESPMKGALPRTYLPPTDCWSAPWRGFSHQPTYHRQTVGEPHEGGSPRKFFTAPTDCSKKALFRKRAVGEEPHGGTLSENFHLLLQERPASRRWKARRIWFRPKGPIEF